MAHHILLVEDDDGLGRQVVERLRQAGFQTTWWTAGQVVFKETMPAVDLVVLDLMLPGVSGLDMLTQIRSFSEVPVLVLSARNDTSDKVRALQLGADDYMTKPFWPEELEERVKARLRRPVLQRDDMLQLDDLEINVASRMVRRNETPIPLTPIELELLIALVRRRGMAVTRSWLANHVLDADGPNAQRALDAHVSRLRKKLGPPKLVETVWGIGYRIGEVARG